MMSLRMRKTTGNEVDMCCRRAGALHSQRIVVVAHRLPQPPSCALLSGYSIPTDPQASKILDTCADACR